jgi:hypothetical protein
LDKTIAIRYNFPHSTKYLSTSGKKLPHFIEKMPFKVSCQNVGATLVVARHGAGQACPYPGLLKRYLSNSIA